MDIPEIALAGNPNTGKTCIFNNLTGSKQRVGNWPGVTVEKKQGVASYRGKTVKIVDLPGTYSLGAYSEDEVVAGRYLLNEKPAAVINVVDACNLQRNLYLTVQMMEAGAKVVVALNMMDEACRSCINIDVAKLTDLLDTAVIPTIASKGQGMDELLAAAVAGSRAKKQPLRIDYGQQAEEQIALLTAAIRGYPDLAAKYPERWLAVKLLEDSASLEQDIGGAAAGKALLAQAATARNALLANGFKGDSHFISKRYEYVEAVVAKSISDGGLGNSTLSDKIDRVATHKWLGIPLFLAVMWLLFEFTFRLSEPLVGFVEDGFLQLAVWAQALLYKANASALFTSFIADGLIGGLGTVLAILPVLLTLFLGISLLEDSGYMARIAYIMDKPMGAVGLDGKAFISFLLGFGCNVPAIMSTRTLESRRDRFLAIAANPFISCAARLPIYVLFAGAFFPGRQVPVIISLYALGLLTAIFTVLIFGKLTPTAKEESFILELPPYRLPTLKGVVVELWEKIADFLKKVTTIILASVIVIWLLSNLPPGVEYGSQASLAGRLSSFIAPIFTWAGFPIWQATIALIFGIMAKEVVVSTLGVVFKTGGHGLEAALALRFTPLSAYAFLVMTLLYAPCVATIATIKNETRSVKSTLLILGYGFTVAWVMAVLVYQVGRLLGFS